MAISAERFNSLKARVKAECSRRASKGNASNSVSVSSYADTAYDYTQAAEAGKLIKAEHRDKIATPLNAINSSVITAAEGQTVITEADLLSMEAFTTTLESRDKADRTGTDCLGGCTGMCYGCTSCTSCTGCSGCTSCSGCSGGCWKQCNNSCEGGCSGCTGCSGTCQGSCQTVCSNNCSPTCTVGAGYVG